jgi:hypothetical protein
VGFILSHIFLVASILSSLYRIPLSIFCSAALLVLDSFCFYYGRYLFLLQIWKIVMLDRLWQLFSFKAWNYIILQPSLHLEFVLRNLLLFWWVCLYMWLVAFVLQLSIFLSLFCVFSILIIVHLGIFVFWSCLFGVLKAPEPGCPSLFGD